ncbi:MAG: DUF4139 domain-containing protein [Planctomycetales bacterium]|nr:DUF4139 domain-containing protein [Planctomycetales bacterium]
MFCRRFLCCVLVLPLAGPLVANEPVLPSRIAAVSLFKNGLALVERRATPVAAGVYQLDEAPRPIHGTMWIEGDRSLVARVAVREREAGPASPSDLQRDYAGRRVTIHLQDVPTPISGVVRDFAREENAEPEANPAVRVSRYSPRGNARFLVLETEQGESLVDTARIAYMQATGKAKPATERQSVLLLEVGEQAKGREVRIRYLTTGLSWAPTYHVDLLDKQRLRISQTALIRNELADVRDAEMQLISGFPNIRFRHVTSPLAPGSTWSQFFSQLNQGPSNFSHVLGNNIAMQQVAFNQRAPSGDMDLSAIPAGDGVDLHYESIGRRSLAKEEAFQLQVAAAEAAYRRIVEWTVPDTHDAYGNRADSRGNSNNEESVGDPWDALEFRNPLPLPMTTGPATITADGRFNGQTISYWVNRGEQTTLKVTKALSIRTVSVENEQQGESRDIVYIANRAYGRVKVDGSVTVSNHRAEPVEMLVRRQFSGDLVRADGDPKTVRREEGAYSINRRHELVWSLTLKPGETRELKYEYRLLVNR